MLSYGEGSVPYVVQSLERALTPRCWMSAKRELHMQRLYEARARIEHWRTSGDNALSPEFEAWKDRTTHSLQSLLGREHNYTRSFTMLSFWNMRISVGRSGVQWTSGDQQRFLGDLVLADHILRDALEELPFVAEPRESGVSSDGESSPTVVVNISNVLSQTATFGMAQITAQLANLPLDADDRATARSAAEDILNEIEGEQHWPRLSKALETLRAIGKGVYERVGLPLLLELIKRQSGI